MVLKFFIGSEFFPYFSVRSSSWVEFKMERLLSDWSSDWCDRTWIPAFFVDLHSLRPEASVTKKLDFTDSRGPKGVRSTPCYKNTKFHA